MIDATKLPTEPCDPHKVADALVEAVKSSEQYARAPDGNGHEAALKERR